MKTLLDKAHNSFDSAIEITLNHDHLGARNSHHKYTLRRHWVETILTGASKGNSRYCYSTYDSSRSQWCQPKKGTSSLFVAMMFCTDKHGNDDISTLHVSRYDSAEAIRKVLESYHMVPELKADLTALADMKEKVSKVYADAKKEAETKHAETRVGLDAFKFGKLYTEDQITKCTKDMPLLKIGITGDEVKPRCRKSDFFSDDMYYVPYSPDADLTELAKTINEKVLAEANNLLHDSYRKVTKAHLTAKRVEYKAPYEGSMFYGFSQMIMARPLDAIKLV